LRISEVLDLNRDDLEPVSTGAHLKVRHGKGDKERMGAIDLKACAFLQLWLEKKKALKIGGPVFSTLKGKPVRDTYIRTMLQRIADKAGITKRVHPHAFRHSCAVGLLKAGKNVVEIQKILGHGSLVTTATYLDHLLPTQALEAVTSTPW
jgi:site-specific recombinase XerD